MMLSRRGLFQRTAAAFAGCVLARMPLAGKAAEVADDPDPVPIYGITSGTTGECIPIGYAVCLGQDGKYYRLASMDRTPAGIVIAGNGNREVTVYNHPSCEWSVTEA